MAYKPGDVVTVKFTGRVDSDGGYDGGNSRVTEEDGTAHYLYINDAKSREEILGNRSREVTKGDAVSVSFRGEVEEDLPRRTAHLPEEDRPLTRVRLLREDGDPYYGTYRTYHFVSTDSPSVRKEGATAAITPDDITITSAALAARITELAVRITELEAGTQCQAVRARNGEVLFQGADESACRTFIEDEDYDPERIIIRRREPGGDAAAELKQLAALKADADVRIGSGNWALYASVYFTQQVIARAICQRLGLPAESDFEKWPLSVIDLAEAGDALLTEDYAYVPFGKRGFFGKARAS